MERITIITTYYNNKSNMFDFLVDFMSLPDRFSLIVIDDGSQISPINDVLKMFDDLERCKVYRVPVDLGFNSHGCRNLGMTLSETKWNLMVDSDYVLTSLIVPELDNLDQQKYYQFTINTVLITKDMFFSCNGYDEEFVNKHMGDREFLRYLSDNFTKVDVACQFEVRRMGRNVIHTRDVDLTTYDEENRVLYQPIDKKIDQLVKLVNFRYSTKDFSTKKIINFPWELVASY